MSTSDPFLADRPVGGRKLHIVFEVVHPADVLFFLRPIRTFLANGDKVTVASRHKDVATDLLDAFGIAHTPISTQGSGIAGLALELLQRDASLFSLARKLRPDLMIGFGGVAISHVGKLLGIPTLAVYDSENARLQTRLAWPFISHVIVPEDYTGDVPEGRTSRLFGTKDLSYFHPGAFQPDRGKAIASGLDPGRANVFVRIVRWGANHDLGKSGWTEAQLEQLVATLSPAAKLHVSSEGDPPAVLKPHLWSGDPAQVHHLLGHCDAYIGESCTMACEAVTLGVPALYSGTDFPGYTEGLARRGLLTLVRPGERNGIGAAAMQMLDGVDRFQANHREWLARCPDWSEFVVRKAKVMANAVR